MATPRALPLRRRSSKLAPLELPELEALRGLGVSFVVLKHGSSILGLTPAMASGLVGLPLGFILSAYTWVGMFFVLSAFLLSRPFLRAVAADATIDWRAYAVRRITRIVPLYACAVALSVVAYAETPADLLRAIPYLAFQQLTPHMTTPLPPDSFPWWSLATEAQFYCLLPLLPCFLRTARGRRLGMVLLVAYAAAWTTFACGFLQAEDPRSHHQIAHSLFGRGPLFLTGIAAAWIYERWGVRWRASACPAVLRRGGADVLLLVLVGALAVLLRAVARVPYIELEATMPTWHLAEAVLWGAIVLVVVLLPLHLRPLLVNRVLLILGAVSYSIYLVHIPVLHYGTVLLTRVGWLGSPHDVHGPLAMLVWIAVSFAVAFATHRVIERPGIACGRRLERALGRRIPATAEADAFRHAA